MADECPNAEVLGVDLSPIQPDWIPPNCKFYVDDYERQWTYREDEAFDYIHGRALSGTSGDWHRFYRQVYNNLKPGGWVEMQEYDAWIFSDDDSYDRAPWTREWVERLDTASKSFGRQINVAKYHKQWMVDAGFLDVTEKVYRVRIFPIYQATGEPSTNDPVQIPIGPWAKNRRLKELGLCERAHMQMSVESHTPALFTRVLGYTPEQVQVLMEGVKDEFRNRDLHLITSYRFICGRRPG